MDQLSFAVSLPVGYNCNWNTVEFMASNRHIYKMSAAYTEKIDSMCKHEPCKYK